MHCWPGCREVVISKALTVFDLLENNQWKEVFFGQKDLHHCDQTKNISDDFMRIKIIIKISFITSL